MNEQQTAIVRQSTETCHDVRRALANLHIASRSAKKLGDDANLSAFVLEAIQPHARAILSAIAEIEKITADSVGTLRLVGYEIGNRSSNKINEGWANA